MFHQVIALKDRFPFLGEEGRDPNVTVYLPDPMTEMGRDDRKRPCLVICPGGGYAMCSQREAEPIAFHFLPFGYNVFVLRYSVAPNRFPTQLREVAALMELIYENAEKWHCDTDRIAIMGFSAGGHLACHYSNCYNCPEVREVFPESKPVQAAVLSYPVITAHPAHRHKGSFVYLSGHAEPTEEDVAKFSLENHVSSVTPPTFLWHTRTDATVPVMNSLIYTQALAVNAVPFTLHVYPAGRHGLATCDAVTSATVTPEMELAARWIDEAGKWLKMTL